METTTNNIISLAKEKVKTEFENLVKSLGQKETAVSSYVHNVISDACDQSEQFAEVIYAYKRTLSDCLKDIMKGVGNSISDIDVYRKAIQFYFPNSEINCTTTISFTGDAPGDEEINRESPPEPVKKEYKPKAEKPAKEKVAPAKSEKPPKPEKPKSDSIQLTLF